MTENDAQQELAFIKKVIEDSRRIIATDGKDFTVWGIIVTIGMLLMYFNIILHLYYREILIWGFLISGGWLYSIYRGFTYYRKLKIKTFAGKILSSVWVSCGIVMTMIGFIFCPLGVIRGNAIMPLIAIITGIGYFITSFIIPSRWIRYCAFGWWLGGILIAAFPGIYTLLVYAGMMICFQVVPGIIIQRQYQKQFAEVSHD